MDYKQMEVGGSVWHRFSRITINNPRPGYPTVVCAEDEVIALGSNEVTLHVGDLKFEFNPVETFELVNPVTNELMGATSTGIDVHVLVYSYVMHEAKKRDIKFEETGVLDY